MGSTLVLDEGCVLNARKLEATKMSDVSVHVHVHVYVYVHVHV